MDNHFSLKNKTVLVTGASSGIGRETAIHCSKAGASLIITGRNPERLNETFHQLEGEKHLQFVADLSQSEDLNDLVKQIPQIDGLVNSAGITTHMPVKFLREKDIESIYHINFKVPVLLSAGILKKKKMKEGASIIFISSIASHVSYFGGAMYSSSKAALENYSRTLALEWAPKKIRSNCLMPTFVKTPMIEDAGKTISADKMDEFEKNSALGFGDTIDVALACQFLLSDASRWITGAQIPMGTYI